MYSKEKVDLVYANTNVGQHVHFHDHTITNNLIHMSHVKMKFLQINLLILHVLRHSHNVNHGNAV